MRWKRLWVASVATTALSGCGPAQIPAPSTWVARASELAASGDTAAALAVLDSAVRREPRNASAWHRLGVLSWAKVRPYRRLAGPMRADHIDLLRRADSSLRIAERLAPDSGRFALELGRFFLYTDLSTLRVQAPAKFDKALVAARAAGDSGLAAEVLDELGMVLWRRYEAVANRWQLRSGLQAVDADALLGSPNGAKNFFENFALRPQEPPGVADYLMATDRFAAALRADPHNAAAIRHTFMALAEQERWEELLAAADVRLRAEPRDASAWLAKALAAQRSGDPRTAAAAFDSALARSTPQDRARYTSLSRVLRASDTAAYQSLSAADRDEYERVYWTVSDPLTLTGANEHRLEFLARVAFAELRWTSDDLDLRGADTDRGQIYVRYGPPGILAAFAPRAERAHSCVVDAGSEGYRCGGAQPVGMGTIVWYYPATNLHFVFTAAPTYGTARFAFEGNYAAVAEEARRSTPVAWTNVRLSALMDTVLVQVARFRATSDSVDVAVFADVPIRRMVRGIDLASGPVDLAFTAFDARARPVVRDSSRQIVTFARPDAAERRSWRRRLAAGELAYRVEALQPDAERGARALGVVRLTPTTGFDLSDLVIADRIAEVAAQTTRWSDLLISPSAGVLRRGQEFGVLWETYDLQHRDGVSRYKVELALTVLHVSRPAHLLARVVGGIADVVGLSAKGDDRVSLSYTRERPASATALDHLTLELGDAPPGRYRLSVRLTDLVSGRSVTRQRDLTLVEQAW